MTPQAYLQKPLIKQPTWKYTHTYTKYHPLGNKKHQIHNTTGWDTTRLHSTDGKRKMPGKPDK